MERRFFYLTPVFALIIVLSFFLNLYAHEVHELDERRPVCLKEYPTDPSLFNRNVSPYVNAIIEKHGLEEWKAVLLTNELHRHLGMWSIIGAKMWIRAREILGACLRNVLFFCLKTEIPTKKRGLKEIIESAVVDESKRQAIQESIPHWSLLIRTKKKS